MKKILLDAGHGYKSQTEYDPGAVNGKYIEAEMTQMYVNSIKYFINQYNTIENPIYQVILTDKMTVYERRKYAEQIKPACFVSVHFNASLNKESKGYEVWYRHHKRFASIIYEHMDEVMSKYSKPRGIKHDTTYGRRLGILSTDISIPTCLIEVGFISNDKEAEWLSQRETRVMICRAIAAGIHKYLTSSS